MRLLTVLAFLLIGSVASAYPPIIEEISQVDEIQASCALCLGGKSVTFTKIRYTYTSCAEFESDDFEIKIEERALGTSNTKETFVSVLLKPGMVECFGTQITRSYEKSTQALEKDKRYVLTNPSVL